MLKLKAKAEKTENENKAILPFSSSLTCQGNSESDVAFVSNTEIAVSDKSKKKVVNEDADFSAFYELAKLLNVSIEQVKDECCMFEVRNLMSRLGKVIVRYNVTDNELEKILCNCSRLTVSEVLLSPAYLPACRRQVLKNDLGALNVSTIIDFPFGESTYKSKVADIKDSIKLGVDGITVMLPAMLLSKDKTRELKKQIKLYGKFYKRDAGVAFSAMDLSEDQIKTAIKLVEKSKLGYVTFIFGEANETEVKLKMQSIFKHKGKKQVKILGNVETLESVMQLFKMGVDRILTPFADNLGEELIKRFKIKSIKLR